MKLKFSVRTRCEIAAITILLLGSCSGSQSYSSDDAYDLADVARANSVNALTAVQNMESKLDDLKSTVELNERNIQTAFDNAEADRSTANENAEISNRALDRLSAIEARLGM